MRLGQSTLGLTPPWHRGARFARNMFFYIYILLGSILYIRTTAHYSAMYIYAIRRLARARTSFRHLPTEMAPESGQTALLALHTSRSLAAAPHRAQMCLQRFAISTGYRRAQPFLYVYIWVRRTCLELLIFGLGP